jgi:ABC-type oligopeptide transport system substrate-binding subunit
LQAAKFVGRDAELAQLSGALDATLAGQGSGWLVGGESGVGKSRLADELRTLALVRGAQVLRGQAVSEGGSPYHLWRDALRWLALTTELAQEQASVLKPLVPDIAELTGFDVPDPPPLDPQATQARLLQVVGEAFGRQERPAVVILEDLQWARSESLAMLNRLTQGVSNLPVLTIGNYRDDERPHLPDELPGMHVLKLARLSEQSIAELSASMLGPAGRREAVVGLLQRETEGNPFFLVEVVRALAEEAGQLERVGVMTLPMRVFADGVRELVRRRLNRVPEPARPLLQLAAVAGRQLELDVLRALAPEVDLDAWLTSCADVAVLEVGDEGWRFAHDNLRAGVLDTLPDDARPGLHRRVAETLEGSFTERVEEQAGLLAHHWEQAKEPEKATEYLSHAGDQARLAYAHAEAIDYYRRALAFLKEQGKHERAARTLMKLGLTYHATFDFQQSHLAYEEGFALWQRAGEIREGAPPPPAPHALRVARGVPPTLDPAMCYDTTSAGMIQQLFSGLVEESWEMNVVPDVARTWEVCEGGRKYVFHLREDVRWSDGAAVTAGDFEYAWKRVLHPVTGSPNASLLYDIKGARAFHQGDVSDPDQVGVRALDELTLVVELEGPTAYFLHLLAYTAAYPVPRHVVEPHGEAWTEVENIVTNGPFRLENWNRGESVFFSRNPEYHGRRRGNLQCVELLLLAPEDWSARLEMYEADGLDICRFVGLPPSERDRARQRHAGEYVLPPGTATSYVSFDTSRSPFNDPRVRRALVLATDRETLAGMVLGGYESPATGGFIPPGIPGHSTGIGLPYDPEQARDLLAEAGYPDGSGFPVVDLTAWHRMKPRCEYLQAQWRENLGVEITWETVEWAVHMDRMRREPLHLFFNSWMADYPDPDSFLRASPIRDWSGWRNGIYDKLVEKARRIMDQGERMRLYGQADRILVEEAVIIPLTYESLHYLVKPWVRNYSMSAGDQVCWKDVIIEPH